jgi:transposase
LANWLQSCGVKTVALQSTGVYWIPLYDILEERGFEVYLRSYFEAAGLSFGRLKLLMAAAAPRAQSRGLHTYSRLPEMLRWRASVC